MTRSRAGLLAALLGLLRPAPAGADLAGDAARLVTAWKRHGRVEHLAPRLAERGTPVVIFLPPELVSSNARICTSVAVLGPTSTHFTVRPVGGAVLAGADDWPQSSLAGLVQLTRCGARRARLGTLLVEMRSPRAVLEVVVVESRGPVRSAVEVLPERNPGPIAPFSATDPRPRPPPIHDRLERIEARSRRDGAEPIERESVKSSARGTGAFRKTVEAGCYRFDVLAEPPDDGDDSEELSVSPQLDSAASIVTVERGDGLDAAVTVCAGERSLVGLEFTGAPSGVPVWLAGARWPLPEHLPESWGGAGRARVAAALRRHGARTAGPPVDQALGVQGPTLMPIRVEPGACYLGVLVAVRGTPHALALALASGNVSAQNHGGPGGDGTVVAFCARSHTTALFEADSRGVGLFWLFALFQNGHVRLGEPAP